MTLVLVLRHSIETRSNTGFYCNLSRSTEAFNKFTCAVHITELPIFWPWINSHTCMDRYGTIIKMERIRCRLLYLMYAKVTSWCTQIGVCVPSSSFSNTKGMKFSIRDIFISSVIPGNNHLELIPQNTKYLTLKHSEGSV